MVDLTPAELQAAADISPSYAHMIVHGARPCTQSVAMKVYKKTGRKIGPLAGASAIEIDALEKLMARAA